MAAVTKLVSRLDEVNGSGDDKKVVARKLGIISRRTLLKGAVAATVTALASVFACKALAAKSST